MRAAERGDHAAYVMASRQAEEALKRRAAWSGRDPVVDAPQST